MSDTSARPQSEYLSPNRQRSQTDSLTMRLIRADTPPITREDLAKLGIESRLIPFILSTALQAERSPDDSPYLTPEEAECLIETLDKVNPFS